MKKSAFFKSSIKNALELISQYRIRHAEALAISRLEHIPTYVPPEIRHLNAAIEWLKRAQKSAGNSGGVAWGYRARARVFSNTPCGWLAPYPETTGYIIPTMLRYGHWVGDSEAIRSAKLMAEWELDLQLPDGGFQGGMLGSFPVASSTFVTGQVLEGLLSAWQEWSDGRYHDAAIKAGHFLLSCLDDSGKFFRGFSNFCAPGPKAYEVRTGLALAKLGQRLGREDFFNAAMRIADYTLSCQQVNGWFKENDLDWHERPLTHTIGYTLEGLQAIGVLAKREDCLNAVQATLDVIRTLIHGNGFFSGRWSSDWTPASEWSCLTGNAQIAGVFLRMNKISPRPDYFDAAKKLLGFVCWTQDLAINIENLCGGIRGSYPFGGEYGQWCALNWATKFFADSLMDFHSA